MSQEARLMSGEASFRLVDTMGENVSATLSQEFSWRRDGEIVGRADRLYLDDQWRAVPPARGNLTLDEATDFNLSVEARSPRVSPTPRFATTVRFYFPPNWVLPDGAAVFCTLELTYRAASSSWWPKLDAISAINVYATALDVFKVAKSVIRERGANRQLILAFVGKWLARAPSKFVDVKADCNMTGWPGKGGFRVDADISVFGYDLTYKAEPLTSELLSPPGAEPLVSSLDWEVV